MEYSIIIAGSGGQGILTLGKLLACAGMNQGLHVTYYPSYGAEVRGGTASCTIKVSDQEIATPIMKYADYMLIFNEPSMKKFLSQLKDNSGTLIYNSSLIHDKYFVKNESQKFYPLSATDIAINEGSDKACNMVMAGYFLKIFNIIDIDCFLYTVEESFHKVRKELKDINLNAFKKGLTYESKQ